MGMTESAHADLSRDLWDYPETDKSLTSLRSSLSEFAKSHEFSLSNTDVEKKISDIRDWVEKQKNGSVEKAKKELVQNVGKFATSTVAGIQKMKSGDALEGTLEIVSGYLAFAGEMLGGPIGAAVGAITGTICSIIGAIFGARKPQQPSIVEQVAEVVHKELVEFNSKLQDQKYDGLKRRVSDQASQLQKMKPGEKLDDPNLWNDYVQFMGELGKRIQSSLHCENELYELSDRLTKDPEVADFVRALMTYCQAFGCFNAVLITAKGTFERLGENYKEDDEQADRKIAGQRKDLKDKLAFLFDEKYLTFLGRLPSEGGKLIKIVAFSRNTGARGIVEMATRGFGFPALLDYNTVESKAEAISHQSVKLKVKGHGAVPPDCIKFINETPYPIKIIAGTAPKGVKEQFTEDLQPRSSVIKRPPSYPDFGGYVIIYMDGKLRPDDQPHSPDVTRVIEFALYQGRWRGAGVNIQDKTYSEFTKGQDTYNKMKEKGILKKNIYWKTEEGAHYMASVEFHTLTIPEAAFAWEYRWRVVFQDFDPSRDIVAGPQVAEHRVLSEPWMSPLGAQP